MDLSKEVLVAIVGVIGMIVTAVLSNWNKLFPDKDQITAKVSGYRSTGVYETELRYFFEVSGGRAMIEGMISQLLQQEKMQSIQEYPEHAKEITEIFHAIAKEATTVDQAIRKLLPVYQKYYSIDQIQELNRFYSTEIMQQMISKNQALTVEAAPLQLELMNEGQERIKYLIEHKLGETGEQPSSSTLNA